MTNGSGKLTDIPRLRQAARPDILDVARRLGLIARLKKVGGEYIGACPKCGGRDRFGISPRKQLWLCRGCQTGGDSIDLLRHLTGASFCEAAGVIDASPAKPQRPQTPSLPTTTEDALGVWRSGVDPRGTAVETYLNGRGLELGDGLAGDVLRWHPGVGAMLALFRNIQTGEPQAISRTFLDRDGNKIGRKFLGPVAGAAVMLDPFEDVLGGLHIGEGVETCMAARQLDLRPTWALGSAGGVASFPVLNGIECLTLLAEHDEASERAVEACARRWHDAGREVLIDRSLIGKDLNDALRGAP